MNCSGCGSVVWVDTRGDRHRDISANEEIKSCNLCYKGCDHDWWPHRYYKETWDERPGLNLQWKCSKCRKTKDEERQG